MKRPPSDCAGSNGPPAALPAYSWQNLAQCPVCGRADIVLRKRDRQLYPHKPTKRRASREACAAGA
jgi:hypothetical protein